MDRAELGRLKAIAESREAALDRARVVELRRMEEPTRQTVDEAVLALPVLVAEVERLSACEGLEDAARLKDELAALQGEVDSAWRVIDPTYDRSLVVPASLAAALQTLMAEIRRAQEALEQERHRSWGSEWVKPPAFCPLCKKTKAEGHAKSCERAR